MALNCIYLHQKGFGGRGAAPDLAGGLGSPLDPRPESMAMNIFTTTSLCILQHARSLKRLNRNTSFLFSGHFKATILLTQCNWYPIICHSFYDY